MTIKAIETEYHGVKFRSRLEARWAVFFDTLNIKWEYEPEAYALSFRNYLPDFLLTSCGTYIEVRGDRNRVDVDELGRIAEELPEHPVTRERGVRLMLLGPMPEPPPPPIADWCWLGFDHRKIDNCAYVDRYSLGQFSKNLRPWWDDKCSGINPLEPTPTIDSYAVDARDAYAAARAYRFWNHR